MTPSTVLVRENRDNASASKFLAARNRGFTALLCYAKIKPAALHRGNFAERRGDYAEAAGPMPEFELSDSRRVMAGLVPAALPAPWLVRS
jgi:hypothetical protein